MQRGIRTRARSAKLNSMLYFPTTVVPAFPPLADPTRRAGPAGLPRRAAPEVDPEGGGDGAVVEEMDVRPGGTYRFSTAYGPVEGEFREVEPPERLVQAFQSHLQTLEFEDLGDRTKLTQTMRFATTEERDTTMQYGVEEGAKGGFARVDELLQRLPLDA